MNNLLKTKEEIRAYVLSYLKEVKTCKISAISRLCFDENTCLRVLNELSNEGLIEKDDNLIWLPSK